MEWSLEKVDTSYAFEFDEHLNYICGLGMHKVNANLKVSKFLRKN